MAHHVRSLAWHYVFDVGNLPSASQASGSKASCSHAGLQHSPLTTTSLAGAIEPPATATKSRAAILQLAPTTQRRRLLRKTSSDPAASVLALYGLRGTDNISTVLVEELDCPSPVRISDTDNSQAAASSPPPGGKWLDEALGENGHATC